MRALAILLLLSADPSHAAMFCTEPRAPVCAEMMMGRFDQSDFDICRFEMESFKTRTNAYLSCLNEESDAALKRYNRAVEGFNMRARGY